MISSGPAPWHIDHRFYLDGLERFPLDADDMRVPAGATLVIVGWAARPSVVPPVERSCRVDGEACGLAFGEHREDLARHFGKRAMADAGFHVAVDVSSLAIGSHELTIAFDRGAFALPPILFSVVARAGTRSTRSQSGRYSLALVAFHSDTAREALDFRVERPTAGIVRGRVDDALGHGAPEALYGIVDEVDVYPALIDPVASTFLLCFLSRTLTIGDHVLRPAIKPRGEAVIERLEPIPFIVSPLSVEVAHATASPSTAVASCSWADDPMTTGCVDAGVRGFGPGALAHVRGWFYDAATADAVRDVHLCFENGEQFKMETRQLRDDVAAAHAVPRARFCGFVGTIAVDSLSMGRNVGRLYAIAKDEVTMLRADTKIEIDRVSSRAAGAHDPETSDRTDR